MAYDVIVPCHARARRQRSALRIMGMEGCGALPGDQGAKVI
ncbi:MAG: hypothetical protein Q7U80_04570 [Thiobacillus sp.]|nr:hypothetical protein [Thiobacillus sp.]MDP3125592.1 hypothetical protein [Thiobacillus sp.]